MFIKFKRVLCLVVSFLMLFAMFPAVSVSAAGGAEVMDTRSLAMINKPGTVLVKTTWSAEMRFYEFSLDDSLFDDIIEIDTYTELKKLDETYAV